MRGTFKLEKVEEINATMAVTMSVKEWRHLRARLENPSTTYDYTAEVFRELIADLVKQAEKTFMASPPPEQKAEPE